MDDVYVKLRDKINEIGMGWPKTDSGVEFTALKRLFSPEDARLVSMMKVEFQTAEDFSEITGMDVKTAADKLYDLSKRGLIFRKKIDGVYHYRIVPSAHGIWEFNVGQMEKPWVEDYLKSQKANEFGPDIFDPKNPPFMRGVPVSKELVVDSEVPLYDDVEKLVMSARNAVMYDCTCRTANKAMGIEDCKHPIRTCLVLNDMADFYEENGWGDKVSNEEAWAMIKEGYDQGRITQILNSKEADCVCSCCGCACHMLHARKLTPNLKSWGNYVSTVDMSKCTRCDICLDKCQMNALSYKEGKLEINKGICLGCGLCVRSCPEKALKLVKKGNYVPADTLWDGYEMNAEFRRNKNK
jgi:Na+-translocating ferredoxin:NAD+ oxidoreductase subunit B